jgi:hypothetical protein
MIVTYILLVRGRLFDDFKRFIYELKESYLSFP